jgi:hypothetical protein
MSYLTRRDLLAVECPRCGAEVGQNCPYNILLKGCDTVAGAQRNLEVLFDS